ncbi:PIR protein [Plasmodium vivax]|uniref:VIR protein n=1 Tax=Plasmodium vivax TaxID=5855 RepID=A0A565A4M9_PLAVI|nr:PIR protein [Plasmodium vivax]
MSLSLDELAKIVSEVYKRNAEYEKLFNKLDNACNEAHVDNHCDNSFNYGNIDISFIPQLRTIFNILQRTEIENDTYIKDVNLDIDDPCPYYKYWFYYKIINNNLKEDDIEELMTTLNENIRGIYRNILGIRCKFYANSLYDVKIMKVLYDHIFIFNNEKNNPNLIEKIKKSEFCTYLKEYFNQIFVDKTITCSHFSPYAFCMEYNKHLTGIINLKEISDLSCESNENVTPYTSYLNSRKQVVEEEATNMGNGVSQLPFPDKNSLEVTQTENAQNSNLSSNNTIIGTGVVGVSSILFLLYKFTSLGSLIRRRKRGINDVMKKYQEGNTDVLLLKNSEGANINYDNNEYNLAYTPV